MEYRTASRKAVWADLKRERCNPVSLLKSTAIVLVFMLHASIFSGQYGFSFGKHSWILQTPAWAAVWICFLASGYLIGKGFVRGRYICSARGILAFYLGRFFKIVLPAWLFVFAVCVIVNPGFVVNNPGFILSQLTFRYRGVPQFAGIGASWYISTLMGLYLAAPFCYMLLSKITSLKNGWIFSLFVVTLICIIQYKSRLWLLSKGCDWSYYIYTPFYMNLDLFLSGMALSVLFCKTEKHIIQGNALILLKVISVVILTAVVIYNIRIYHQGDITRYTMVMPSVYIPAVLFYLFAWDAAYHGNISGKRQLFLVRVICRGINSLMGLSFGFYLCHSQVLESIAPFITHKTPLEGHVKLMAAAFLLSLPIAWVIEKTGSVSYGFYREKILTRILKQGDVKR